MVLLNIGSGSKRIEGYVNIDIDKNANPDVLWNLEKTPLPFDDMSVHGGFASHVLEHIQNLVPLMEDLWRITMLAGIWDIRVPHYISQDAWSDPTHVRAFSHHAFSNFYHKGWQLSELNVSDAITKAEGDKLTHIHAVLRRLPKLIRYVPESYLKDGIKNGNGETVEEGLVELEKLMGGSNG